MKITPNIGMPQRILYVVVGAGVAASPLFVTLHGLQAVVVPVLGLAAVASGATGF